MANHTKEDITDVVVELGHLTDFSHDVSIENSGPHEVCIMIDDTGKDASATEYTTKLPVGGYWVAEANHTGRITAICPPGKSAALQITKNF